MGNNNGHSPPDSLGQVLQYGDLAGLLITIWCKDDNRVSSQIWYCLQRDETDDDCLVSYRSLDCPTVCGCAGLHIPKHLKVIDQLDATIALLRETNSLYYPLGGMLVVKMSKFWYQTEKSKYCRKPSNESIYKLSSTLPSTFSKFQEMQELHLNETLHCTLGRGACHTVGYLRKPLCLDNVETFLQKTNGCQYHVQMKPYSKFSGYVSY